MTWVRDPIEALEEHCYTADTLPSRAPVLSRPTLRVHVGQLPETTIGLYGTDRRRALEMELISCLLSSYGAHISAAGAVKSGQEGTSRSQWDFLFTREAQSAQIRQGLVDTGYCTLHLASAREDVTVAVRDGPGRLPSSLTKIVVSNLPADFMTRGVVSSLLESAGYSTDSSVADSVVIRAEHGGEQRGELAAFAPDVIRLGVVIGIVRAPTGDAGLGKLPRKLRDLDSTITIQVSGHRVPADTQDPQATGMRVNIPAPRHPSQAMPGFVRADPSFRVPPPAPLPVGRPLDIFRDLHSRLHRDRRGLGMEFPPPSLGMHFPPPSFPAFRPPLTSPLSASAAPFQPAAAPTSLLPMEIDGPHHSLAVGPDLPPLSLPPTQLHAYPMDIDISHPILPGQTSDPLPPPPSSLPPPPPVGNTGAPTEVHTHHMDVDTPHTAVPVQTSDAPPPPPSSLPPPPPVGDAGGESHAGPEAQVQDRVDEILQDAPHARIADPMDCPLTECVVEWMLDQEIAVDTSAAMEVVRGFCRERPEIWETYAQDPSRPPHSTIRVAIAQSIRDSRTVGTTPHPRPQGRSHTRTSRPPQAQDSVANRRGRRRASNPLPWYHSDRLRQTPPGLGPRGNRR